MKFVDTIVWAKIGFSIAKFYFQIYSTWVAFTRTLFDKIKDYKLNPIFS